MAAAEIIGWYGPLIDICKASSYIDDFVQLLVFVHSSQPLQKDHASKGATLMTCIQVGDETRSYFSVSIWQKHMGSMIVAGDIILLQNVKIVKFRNELEAATAQISSVLVLVHSSELAAAKGIDDLVPHGQLGEPARAKFTRVVNWVHRTESALSRVQKVNSYKGKGHAIKNWKTFEEKNSRCCSSISEVLRLTNSCHANFRARITELFIPFVPAPGKMANKHLFVTGRLSMVKSTTVEDLISTGCRLCGSPMISRSVPEQVSFPLYCKNNSSYHHEVCHIYRPFLLYVWDHGGQIPLLVKNKGAEILFGNITAESVYKSYQESKNRGNAVHKHLSNLGSSHYPKASSSNSGDEKSSSMKVECSGRRVKPTNFYGIWLILVKALLQHDKNSPFQFEVRVDGDKDAENGRFEFVSFVMPCTEQ